MVWNLEGAYKIRWTDVTEFLQKFDLVVLIESWLGKNDVVPELNELVYKYKIDATKIKGIKKGRKSGGILLYCKPYLSNRVIKLEMSTNNVLWIKLDKAYFGFVYNPPDSSAYKCEDFFDELKKSKI